MRRMADSIEPDEGEHLATGWEPGLPATDTLVRRAVEVHASWLLAVAASLGRPSRRTDRWAGAFVGERGSLTNPVVVTRPLAAEEYAEVVAQVADLVPTGVPFFLVSPFPTPDLSPLGRQHPRAAATWAATLCEPDLPTVLIASDDGRPLYESMGYLALERWTAWIRPTA